jgi:LuxR family maltose regulon positive regulatory protein
MLAAHGDVPAALEWVRERGLSPDDDLSYLREYEHVTLARVLLARHARHASEDSEQVLADAIELLQRLLAAAEDGDRAGTVIEILALLALARRRAGENAEALDALTRALLLAQPEGYVRVFAAEGQPMAALLGALDRRRPGWSFLRRVLDAAAQPTRTRDTVGKAEAVRSGQPGQQSPGGLVDPLTERERDVLRLLASELDGPAIARELVVSLNTVRTHTKNIYAKLGVTNRRAAVARAHQLNLLSPTGAR